MFHSMITTNWLDLFIEKKNHHNNLLITKWSDTNLFHFFHSISQRCVSFFQFSGLRTDNRTHGLRH